MTPQEKIKHYVNSNKPHIVKTLYRKYGKEFFYNKTGDNNLFFELSLSNILFTQDKEEIHNALKMIDFLIESGFDINDHHPILGDTPLFYFIDANSKIFQYVIRHTHNINASNDDNENAALSFFENSSQLNMANLELLIQSGIDINQQNLNQQTLLMKAARKLAFPYIDLLTKYNVNPNLKDKRGNTSLHYAVNQAISYESIQKKTIASLMKFNTIDINAKNNGGNTPLKISCSKENDEAVLELLKQGASIYMQDEQGKQITILDFIHNKTFAFQDKKNQMIDLVKPFCERVLINPNSISKKKKISKML